MSHNTCEKIDVISNIENFISLEIFREQVKNEEELTVPKVLFMERIKIYAKTFAAFFHDNCC